MPDRLVAQHGWAGLSFSNEFGPLAGVAMLLGLGWLAGLVVVSALSEYDGGLGLIGFGVGFPVMAVLSVLILWWAVALAPSTELIERNIAETSGPGEPEAQPRQS